MQNSTEGESRQCHYAFLQEAAEVNSGADATLWGTLHGVYGSSLHGGHWAALADTDAL